MLPLLPNRWRPAGYPQTQVFLVFAALALLIIGPLTARAQDRPSLASQVTKGVVFDPTTYAPATLAYTSMRLDWDSSQPFFRNGITEHNPAFTTTGLPDGQPISYGAGHARILGTTMTVLGTSVAHNIGEQVLERALIARNPQHRRLIRVLGWFERAAVASYIGYQASVLHFEQWGTNKRMAAERGYR